MIELNAVELDSPLVSKLVKHFEQRLDELRARNDADLDQVQTAAIRGQIKECKSALQMLRGKPAFASSSSKRREA